MNSSGSFKDCSCYSMGNKVQQPADTVDYSGFHFPGVSIDADETNTTSKRYKVGRGLVLDRKFSYRFCWKKTASKTNSRPTLYLFISVAGRPYGGTNGDIVQSTADDNGKNEIVKRLESGRIMSLILKAESASLLDLDLSLDAETACNFF